MGDTVVNGTNQPLAAHFDGTSLNAVPTPTLSQGGNFYGVAAAARNDVWAVGYQNVGSSLNTLIEHWDGTSWSIVSSPKLPNGAYLQAVTAVSSTDVWAAGDINVSKEGVLIEHWDGTSWSIVSSPAFTGVGPIYGISAGASNNVWAVGGNKSLHFDGTSWSLVAGVSTVNMTAVTALSSTNVWAVGVGPGATRNSFPRGAIVHCNGTSWSIVPSPNPHTNVNSGLGSVAAVSADNIWATGSDAGPLVENWNGTSWSVVSFPTGVGIGPITALSDGTVFVATSSGFLWRIDDAFSSPRRITPACAAAEPKSGPTRTPFDASGPPSSQSFTIDRATRAPPRCLRRRSFQVSQIAPIHHGEHTDEPENQNPTSIPADDGSVA